MKILYCSICKEFTMNEVCKCGNKTISLKPQKYSPVDKYAMYRRIVVREELSSKGVKNEYA